MDPAAYYEAKSALQNLRTVALENELRAHKAQTVASAVLARLQIPVASGYSWDDATLTITPVESGHVR